MKKEKVRGHGTGEKTWLKNGDTFFEMTKDNLAKEGFESFCDIDERRLTLATGVNRGLNELDKLMIKTFSI